jgi:hypothetical protein
MRRRSSSGRIGSTSAQRSGQVPRAGLFAPCVQAVVAGLVAFASLLGYAVEAAAEDPSSSATRVLEFQFTPVGNAQIAIWVEDDAGKFLATAALTEAVARRGIGNRPGASQMNSGFRWPYGRREGVLPVWAHSRLTADGAQPFRRVIFQKRTSEGLASRTSEDYSRDDYFCLSFNNSRSKQDALDAVSCASVFNSDKGRFITDEDVQLGYAEPYEDVVHHVGRMQPLTTTSLYPPRRDIKTCAPSCLEHPDVATYDDSARAVMPDIDTVSMATAQGGMPQRRLFSVPRGWVAGSYRACLEINVEGDHNASYSEQAFPTPTTPQSAWDSWATSFGYPYRGQPSVVYCVPFELRDVEATFTTDSAAGSVASWDTAAGTYGRLDGMDGMSDDPVNAPGSGADRLKQAADGSRLKVIVTPPLSCMGNHPPSQVEGLELAGYPDKLHAHQWAQLKFKAAADDTAVFRYDVRVSTDPIVDDETFMRGQAAKSATMAADELRISAQVNPGTEIRADFGGLIAETHYYVGVRAIDACAAGGSISVAEITTPKRQFATVSPCFVATAAYGTPMAAEITALRRFRDRHLASNGLGRLFVTAYGIVGPKLADFIRGSEALRAVSRAVLAPVVAAVRTLDPPSD